MTPVLLIWCYLAGTAQVHYDPVLPRSVLPAGICFKSTYDPPVLLESVYLQDLLMSTMTPVSSRSCGHMQDLLKSTMIPVLSRSVLPARIAQVPL